MSFIASGGLALIGYATFKQTTEKRQWWVAAIPLIFALQQLCEGLLWLALRASASRELINALQMGYLLALLAWPVWFPLSFFMLEKRAGRRKILGGLLIIGTIFAIGSFLELIRSPLQEPVICGHSIQYLMLSPERLILLMIYFAILFFSTLISSFPLAWLYGIVGGGALIPTLYLYWESYMSIWCFWGAVSSGLFLFIFWHHKKGLSRG